MKQTGKSRMVLPARLLRRLYVFSLKDGYFGDMEEEYRFLVKKSGNGRAAQWYWGQLLQFLPKLLWIYVAWGVCMTANTLKMAWRHSWKNRGHALLNIFGLGLGLAVVILILLYVGFETTYDRDHPLGKRIYRIMAVDLENGGRLPVTPAPLGPALKESFPEVEQVVRMRPMSNVLISANGKHFFEDYFVFSDPAILNLFPFADLDAGILADPFSVLISKSMAEKYFGTENPIGKTVTYLGAHDFTVKGVVHDAPSNSIIQVHFIVPFTTVPLVHPEYDLTRWGTIAFHSYALLRNREDLPALREKMPGLLKDNLGELASRFGIDFVPLQRLYLSDDRIKVLGLLSGIALLILAIACINYLNLETARASQRSREIGIRKVAGAMRGQIFRQFMGESALFTITAFGLGLLIAAIALPWFNQFAERALTLNPLRNGRVYFLFLGLMAAVIAGAGFVPSIALSAYHPVSILRGQTVAGKRSVLRNVLVVFQFSISLVLIIAALVLKGQLQYIQKKDLGFHENQILVVDVRDPSILGNMDTIQERLKQHPGIINASVSSELPNITDINLTVRFPNKPEGKLDVVSVKWADENYVDLFDLTIVEGRNFSRDFSDDASGAVLLNQAAVRALGWETAVGKEFGYMYAGRQARVVGVVKDFHMNSLHHSIEPLCIDFWLENADSYLSVRFGSRESSEIVRYVQETIAEFAPTYPFVYRFFEDMIDEAYKIERKMDPLFTLFSILALIIACMGLLGLVSFSISQRTKEVGIRKVLGATVSEVMALFTRQFLQWVILANFIACPLAYFALKKVLDLYVYRISLRFSFFLAGVLVVLILALLTIGVQCFRAARTNPSESLRIE